MDEKIEIPMSFWRDIKDALNHYVKKKDRHDGKNHCWKNARDVSKKMEILEIDQYYKQYSLLTYEKEGTKAVPVALWNTVVAALARFVEEIPVDGSYTDVCCLQGAQAMREVDVFIALKKEPS